MPGIADDGNRTSSAPQRVRGLLAWATISVVVGGSLGGCLSVFRDSADHDVYALLNKRERQVLGHDVEDEITPGEVPVKVTAQAYNHVPKTETALPPGYQMPQEPATQPEQAGPSGAESVQPVPTSQPGPGTAPTIPTEQAPPTSTPAAPATATTGAARATAAATTAPSTQTAATAPGSDLMSPGVQQDAMSDSVDSLVKSMPQIDLNKLPPLPKFPKPLRPGETRLVFSLEDCFDYALNHSRDYQTHKEDLYIQALRVLLQRHQFEPQPFARTTADIERTPEGNDYDLALRASQSLGVRQNLPYGGQVSAQYVVSLVDQLRSRYGSPSHQGSLTIQGDIPLLRGAGLTAQENLIQSERSLVYSVRDFEDFRRNFLVTVASSYFNLVNQRAQVRNAYRSVDSYSFITARTQALFDAGRPNTTLLDVQRALQSEYSARNNLINAVESYELDVDNFKLLLGMPVEQPLDIASQYLNIAPPDVPENAAIQVALRLRLDLQTVRDKVEDARRGVAVAQNNLLPDLNLTGSANVSNDPTTHSFGVDFNQPDLRAGVTLDWPLDRVAERNSYRTSLINLDRAKRNRNLTEDQVAIDVRSALRRVRQQTFLLALQKNNIDLATKRKEFADIQYRNGEVDNRDYLDAETSLLDAENRFASALASLQVAVLQYLRDTGQMRVNPHGNLILPASLVVENEGNTTQPGSAVTPATTQPGLNAPLTQPAPATQAIAPGTVK